MRLTHFGIQRAVPPGSYLLHQGLVYHLALKSHLFRGMSMGSKAFLEPLAVSGLFPVSGFHIKKGFVPHFSIRGTLNKYQVPSPARVSRGCLTRVPGNPSIRVTWLRPKLLRPQGGAPPRFSSASAWSGFSPDAWGTAFREMLTKLEAFVEPSGVSGQQPCA